LADDRKKYGDNEEIETLQAQENGATSHPAASDDNENNNASGDVGGADGQQGHEGSGDTDEDP